MSRTPEGKYADVALLLYAAPFILNFAYALYLWSGAGFSSTLPQLVYLEVSQNPYVFLVGFAAIALAIVLDYNDEPPESRKGSLFKLSERLQAIAVISVVLSLIAALYAASGDVSTMFFNLLDGRYPLVFPALLVFLSFLILPSFRMQVSNTRNLLVVVFLIASPLAIYELGKRNTFAGLGVGLILILASAYLMLRPKKE